MPLQGGRAGRVRENGSAAFQFLDPVAVQLLPAIRVDIECRQGHPVDVAVKGVERGQQGSGFLIAGEDLLHYPFQFEKGGHGLGWGEFLDGADAHHLVERLEIVLLVGAAELLVKEGGEAVCDIDSNRIGKGIGGTLEKTGRGVTVERSLYPQGENLFFAVCQRFAQCHVQECL